VNEDNCPTQRTVVDQKDRISELDAETLWNNIGFHRPIGGFFFDLPFRLIQMVLGIALVGFIYGFLYPFPESMGYKTAATGIFSIFFQIFDLGTAYLMDRFIGETNVKNPKKMVQYVQYFIWYQMFTGLVQVTAISWYALLIVPRGELAYAIWIMLIFSTTQYPSMLGVFKNVLNTLQQYDKRVIVDFIQGEVFQRITEIVFVIWGKYWGENNPEIGQIMGIAIGSVIGLYVDDFIALIVSAKFFQKTMKVYGLSVGECFRHDFDWSLVKECLSWGIKSGFPPMLWTIQSYFALIFWLQSVPQYTTFAALFGFAGTFSGLVGWNLDLGGSLAEAYLNGKKELTKYYIAQAWRYTGLIQFLMISAISVVLLVIEPALIYLGLENYVLSIAFIVPRIVRDFQQPYNNISSNIIISAGRVNFLMFTQIMEAALSLVCWILFIPVFKIPQTYGFGAIIWLMPCGELPAIITKIIVNYVYIEKKILKLNLPLYQTWVVPMISTFSIFLVGYIFVELTFMPMVTNWGMYAAIIITILTILLTGPFFIYFPITGLLGGWDDGSLRVLERAVKISGGGKILAALMLKMLRITTRKSKLHNRFMIDETIPLKEARELMELRNSHIEKKLEII
jgi:hypothetical protein